MKNWYKLSQVEKILYVMRGVSGSGKSTVAKSLPGVVPENIFSTDALIGDDLETYNAFFYNMEESKDLTPLSDMHKRLIVMVREAMSQSRTPLVLDNTNIEPWQCKPSVQDAFNNGYRVEFVEVGTGGKTPEELAQRNQHQVPLKDIQEMVQKYDAAGPLTIEKVLGSDYPEEHIA